LDIVDNCWNVSHSVASSAELPPVGPLDGLGDGPRGQQIVGALRNAIIAGRYEPGDRLIEATLSKELGTSRGPVREALQQLEHEGLVMSVPYRGAVVLGVSDEEVQEVLIPIRLTLERYSFGLALQAMSEADFAELGKQVWVMEQGAKSGDLLKIVEADLHFHDAVISRSGRTHTVQLWRSITPRIRAYFYSYGRKRDLHEIVEEHRELLEALQTRDPDVVMKLLEPHIATPPPPERPATATRPRRRATKAG
jgi:DNA-binding GntR family transcriptional regulator